MVQSYSPGAGFVSSRECAMSPPGEYTEVVHSSSHSISQPKRQIDRFSRSCTAHGRRCLYFTVGAPIHQNCPISRGDLDSDVTHDALGPLSPQTKRHLDRFCLFAQVIAGCPYILQWFTRFPLKIAPFHGGSASHVIHGSLGPPES